MLIEGVSARCPMRLSGNCSGNIFMAKDYELLYLFDLTVDADQSLILRTP